MAYETARAPMAERRELVDHFKLNVKNQARGFIHVYDL